MRGGGDDRCDRERCEEARGWLLTTEDEKSVIAIVPDAKL
jgi:hypothetical protein